jgi:hypothetical protein
MSKRNWQRCSDSKKIKGGAGYEFESEWRMKRKYAAYRDGNFFIGSRLVERYRPTKEKPPETGLVLNAASGKFEVWKKASLMSDIHWKKPWRELATWAKRWGYESCIKEEASESGNNHSIN